MRTTNYHLKKRILDERERRIDAATARLVRRPCLRELQRRMDEETLRALEGVADGVCGEGEI